VVLTLDIFFFWYVYPSNLEAMLPCPWLITDDAMPLDHLLRRPQSYSRPCLDGGVNGVKGVKGGTFYF